MDDRDLAELQAQLDAAFQSTRPRRGFQDELWDRLQRRVWWRRLQRATASARPALGGLAAVLLVAFGVLFLISRGGHPGGGASETSSAPTSRGAAVQQATFGLLPRPSLGGEAAATRPGASSETAGPAVAGRALPATAVPLPVYRYGPAAGLQAGTVLDPASIPPGLPSATYPALSPADALAEVQAAPRQHVTVTGARLVYVAVAADGSGYLEPEYVLTGTTQSDGGPQTPFSVRVAALAASAFR